MIELDSPALEALVATLGWTLLHFLWQGAVGGVLFGVSLAAAGNASAQTRYRLALLFMLLLAAAPVATFLWLSPHYASAVSLPTEAIPATVSALTVAIGSSTTDWQGLIQPWLPWAVLIWAAGVTFMTGGLLIEWRNVRRLARLDVAPLTLAWQHRVKRLTARLGVRCAVRALLSARVHVPMVVGWLRPVILVPVSAVSGLTTWQLELILMHELAHIRRYDHLVNLLQVVIETLLFYHPVVRWVSRVLREEREHCCDDLVVARSGDVLAYARALTELAGVQSLSLQTSVASDGGQLLARIRRLVGVRKQPRVAAHWSIGVMLAMVAVSISGLLQPLGGDSRERDDALASQMRRDPHQQVPDALLGNAQELPGSLAFSRPQVLIPQPDPPALDPQPLQLATEQAGSALPPAMVSNPPRSQGADAAPAVAEAAQTSPVTPIDTVASEPRAAGEATSESAAGTVSSSEESTEPDSSVGTSEPSPSESLLVTAPAAASATDQLAPGSVVDRARMAAVDRVAHENGVKLVWLNPPVVNDPSGSAPQVGFERGDLTASKSDSQVARAIAILQPQPEFPDRARQDSIEGWVTVSYIIGRDGRVSDVAIVAAQPRNVFEGAVRKAVRSWRFEPVTVDGQTVEQKKTQTIKFSLSDVQPVGDETCTVSTGTRICRPAGR